MSSKLELGKEKRNALLALFLIAVTFALRMCWLGDMEFKSDEAEGALQIAGLTGKAWQPLAGVSHNSGIAHSSGFFYFLNWITPNPENPLHIARSIAFVNSLFLALAIWLLRNSSRWLLTFAFCATSATLVFGSRKIWSPDLMQAWVILGIGFLGFVLEKLKPFPQNSWALKLMTAEAAFLLVMSGHMYLPGGLGAAVMTGVIALWLFFKPVLREKGILKAWVTGSALGWLTFVPYFYLMLTHAPGTRGESTAALFPASSSSLLEGIGKAVLSEPSTFPFFQTYVRGAWDQLGTVRDDGFFKVAAAALVFGGILMLILYGLTLFRTFLHRRALLEDPIVLSTVGTMVVFPAALFFSRLGNHLHYWFGVLPLLYHWIAWALEQEPGSRVSRAMRVLGWVAVAAVGIGTFALESVVHRHGGMAGEYGVAYQNSDNSFAGPFRSR